MREYIQIYKFYRTALLRSIRLGSIVLLLVLIYFELLHSWSPKFFLLLLNLIVMWEIFFHYKISRARPTIEVSKNDGKDIYTSFTMQAAYYFLTENKTSTIIRKLIQYPQVQLIMQKAAIASTDLSYIDIDKKILAQSAFDTASTFRGKYVSTLDVFIAYILLIEKDKKLLFAKQLKTTDLLNILYWTKLMYPEEENPPKVRVRMYGAGIGEALVSGWTPETKKYTSNFTYEALKEEPLIKGREEELKEMFEGLVKQENSNVLLVGDIGSGKENLVRALAWHSFQGNLGSYLNHKRVFELMVGPLTAGVGNRGDLETRLQDIIAEVSHANDVMLYIPEFQNIVGGTSYNLDLSGALLPYLKSGNLPIIATMTVGNFKTYMQKNPLQEAFTVVSLREPDRDTAIQMILGEADNIENKYKVILSYRAIRSSVGLAEQYFDDAALPGSAVVLLQNVANAIAIDKNAKYFDKTKRKLVEEEDVVHKVEETKHVAIGLPSEKEIQLLLHLEDRLHERVIDQVEGVTAISEAMRRLRSGMSTSTRPISFLFLGPTGVGKTETAKALADLYYGGEKNMIRLDMSEYSDIDGVRRLLGAAPGEGQERGELTDKIHDNPASLILLDEFEKAHPKIHDLFLQVLDDGRLTDNKGVTVSFRNSIIIATSNAGSEFIREAVEKKTPIDRVFQKKLLEVLQSQALMRPELLNRFDDIITFKPLGPGELSQVITMMIKQLQKTLQDQDITLTYDDAVMEKITNEGYDQEFGARPIRRYIQDNIEDLIAQKKLTKELDRGKTIALSVDGTGAFSANISPTKM